MLSFDEVLNDQLIDSPTLINPGGEEVWHKEGSNYLVVRLKPGTKSELYHHYNSQERYSMAIGQLRFCCDGYSVNVKMGQSIVLSPPQSHIVFNETDEAAIFIARINIPWNPLKIL
jgi:mannose-6-phosphate isomerase-like protein (cupin superfamily)